MQERRRLDWLGKARNGATVTVVGSVVALEPNARRIGATFVNDSGALMYLSKAAVAAVVTGILLRPNGGSYEINFTNPYYGPIAVACVGAGNNLVWTEDE